MKETIEILYKFLSEINVAMYAASNKKELDYLRDLKNEIQNKLIELEQTDVGMD